mmetsp:Transcript_28710/g.44996  ORF Transcript_28710/g.44996 Transcript_28710/m.44996 type:complete len:217 (-) Transcript_28710:337-987(-)
MRNELDQEDFVLLVVRLGSLASVPVKDTHARSLGGSWGAEWNPLAKAGLPASHRRVESLAVVSRLGALKEWDGDVHHRHAEASGKVERSSTPMAAVILVASIGGGAIAGGYGGGLRSRSGDWLGGDLLALLLGLGRLHQDLDRISGLRGLALVPVLNAHSLAGPRHAHRDPSTVAISSAVGIGLASLASNRSTLALETRHGVRQGSHTEPSSHVER